MSIDNDDKTGLPKLGDPVEFEVVEVSHSKRFTAIKMTRTLTGPCDHDCPAHGEHEDHEQTIQMVTWVQPESFILPGDKLVMVIGRPEDVAEATEDAEAEA